ncbi:autotransporter-associated beta strand repeat-containing protein [Dyella jiangningensis]|uniref:autotransporter serine protease n=1 Tax=Dyella sp. AtDHG13 TaxID=1938897 RepID=UPI000885B3D9|nr:autotransporter serine protease [Dyella sp. AtDHG13]PXV56098.1 autotransporter-associated beta strand protein [Dyella sp. AtDHG13]SDK71707.1 autotransporter-associated beta strand repeat-containing protein [Dyella jiangningensis]
MTTVMHGLRYRRGAVLVWLALGLAACGGGGGGNTRPTASTPPPAPPPAPPPSSSVPQPPIDAQLGLTNTYAAHNAGYTGAGVTIGVVDTGVMSTHPALAGRVIRELTYVDPSTNNLKIDDVNGHGTYVAEIAAGKPFGQFAGGIATGASIVSARIIDDNAPDDNGTTPASPVTGSDAVPLEQVNADLIANGVKVMNNSWGGISWSATDTATTQAFDNAYSPFINSWGGLVVFAAGNDSQANPSTIAALPSLAPDLQKGWLTVVAINSNNPTQLDSYSNKCGIAMNYCLAAPGDVIVSGKSDTSTSNESYWIVEGTSLAAPQVSGAAALVWQAYPYFSNDLVRQTLLGTADPLGGSQPNATYGYGELDVGKAVNGPAQFNWGDVTVNFSGSSSWNNPISGAGGLIKQGTGTLTLTQPSSYTGLTQVQGGMLVAASLASSVSIGAQGVLSGTPSVGGSVTNAGVLAVGSSNVTVGGNYLQQGAGRLAVSLGSSLRVNGTATLSGGDLYITGINQGYQANAHTDVLTANGGLSGTFSALNAATGVLLTASLNYNATEAWLNVSQVQASAVTGMTYTPASFGAAQRIDGAFSQINAQVNSGTTVTGGPLPTSFIQGAANLQQTATTAALQQSLSSLSGQLLAASAAMTFDAMDAGTRALSQRFDQLGDVYATGGWTRTLGSYGSLNHSGYSDVGYDLSGWMVGQDRRLGINGVMGFAVSQSQDLGRLDEFADQGRSRAVEGTLYGGIVQNQWYAMGRLGMGTYREDMRRHIELGSDVESVASNTNGTYDVAYGESGYRMQWGGVNVTPYLNLQYANIRTDGFNELGGDGFGLKAGSQDIERWQAGAGLRAGRGWALSGGGRFSLQAHLLWQRAFSMRGDVLDASFAVLNQWAPVGGIGLSRYGGDAGVNLDWSINKRSSLSLGMDQYVAQHEHGKMDTLAYRLSF